MRLAPPYNNIIAKQIATLYSTIMFFRSTVAASLIPLSSSGASADDVSPSSIRGALDKKNKKPWRPDLPWNQLRSKLQHPSSLIHASVNQFVDECVPEFDNAFYSRTNWALINQSSGLCMDQLFCAFKDCDPKPNSVQYPLDERLDSLFNGTTEDFYNMKNYSNLSKDYKNWIQDASNNPNSK